MAQSFGRLLQRYRVAAGLSQERLAELSGVSTNAISALERGLRHAPHSATLDLLVAALKLDHGQRVEIEEAAKRARALRIHAKPQDLKTELRDGSLLNNLPPELTSFVDRDKELAEIKTLLQRTRLVTLVGSGGAGKTRCALRVASMVLDEFADGVWLVELAPNHDPLRVSTVIANALKLQEVSNRPMLDTVLAYLKQKRLLLILDNCEHVISEVRRVTATILHECPSVCILATSRESLAIAGERVYRIPSLGVPSAAEVLSVQDVSQYGALKLFSDRARSVSNRFALSVESAPDVADICRRLDGIPLAIELAAARISVLSPHALAQKLDERFRVLTGKDRSALPRHQTMHALIDWSYDLLPEDERRLFRKLSIFAGGFTLETAAAVCEEDGVDEVAMVDLLASLVDKSLVQMEIVEGDARYSLLETTRQYAREKLRNAGEEESIARAHAYALLSLGEEFYEAYGMKSDRSWYVRAELELENFRAALSWAFGLAGDALLGQRLACVLRPIWFSFGSAEGQRWIRAAQERVTENTPAAVLAMLDYEEATHAGVFGQHKASLTFAERALTRYRELSNPRGIAEAELRIGRAQIFLGEIAKGQALIERSLAWARFEGTPRAVVSSLECLALARQFAGDFLGARQCFREELAAARAMGAERWPANIAMNLAEVEFHDGDPTEALRLANEALAATRSFRDHRNIARAGYNSAAYLVALHRFDEARAAAREAVKAACDAQFSVGLVWALQHLAATAALRPSADAQVREDRRRAARILGYVDAALLALEASREYTEQQEYDQMIQALCDALGDDELSRFMALGSAWSEDQAIAEAMLI